MGSHPARYGDGCVGVDSCCDVIEYGREGAEHCSDG